MNDKKGSGGTRDGYSGKPMQKGYQPRQVVERGHQPKGGHTPARGEGPTNPPPNQDTSGKK